MKEFDLPAFCFLFVGLEVERVTYLSMNTEENTSSNYILIIDLMFCNMACV